MRIVLLTIISLFCFSVSKAQTSVYHPMPDSMAEWCESATWGMCPAVDKYILKMEGDTILNSIPYHKLYAGGNTTCQQYPATFYAHDYRGAFREDTALKKVYYVDIFGSETLIYDFSLVVGDTIPGSPFVTVITGVDSVLVGSNYRKRFLTNGYYMNGYLDYVEGIGSNMGFYQIMYLGIEYGATLHTYLENQTEILQLDNYGCSVMLDVTGKPEQLQLEIFPNPSTGAFTISFGKEISEGKMEITDVLGNLVFSASISNQSTYKCELPAGIFIVAVTDQDNKTVNKKMVSCRF